MEIISTFRPETPLSNMSTNAVSKITTCKIIWLSIYIIYLLVGLYLTSNQEIGIMHKMPSLDEVLAQELSEPAVLKIFANYWKIKEICKHLIIPYVSIIS